MILVSSNILIDVRSSVDHPVVGISKTISKAFKSHQKHKKNEDTLKKPFNTVTKNILKDIKHLQKHCQKTPLTHPQKHHKTLKNH